LCGAPTTTPIYERERFGATWALCVCVECGLGQTGIEVAGFRRSQPRSGARAPASRTLSLRTCLLRLPGVSRWFSDRSATYLAAGRPVITQDTGFGSYLPTG
jgi:hypothetical protein